MESYAIDSQWFQELRCLDKPGDYDWEDLFSSSEFTAGWPFSNQEANILSECAIPFPPSEVSEMINDLNNRFLLERLNLDGLILCKASQVEILVIDATPGGELIGLQIGSDGYLVHASPTSVAHTLLESWASNPDREKAWRAREYLCEALGKMPFK